MIFEKKIKVFLLLIKLDNSCLENDRDSTTPHIHSLKEIFYGNTLFRG